MSFQLSDHDLQQYEELGYAGPFKLLESHEVEIMTRKLVAEKSKFFFRNRLFSRIPGLKNLPASVKWGKAKWYKAMHIVSPLTREIASRPEILDRITSIIGEEMLMWGAMMLTIKQSDRPAWHLDDEIEFLSLSEAASVWIALTNVTEESGLRIITRSHK
ncbi:MAG: phytanoyl-CoA dioxygenase family protein, partial [Phormidesmis sp.]